MSKATMNKTPKAKIDDFSGYRTGFSYSTGSVLLTNDDCLSFEEKRLVERRAKLTCIVHATKIKNLKKATERRKIDQKSIENSPVDLSFPYDWFNSFTEDQLKKLFERYYVPGFHRFCLAIIPENVEGLPLYKFTLPDYLITYNPKKDSRNIVNFGVDHYFETLIDTIRKYGNNCLSKDDFLYFIKKIRSIAERVHLNKQLRKSDCLTLDKLIQDLPEDKTISTDILAMMIASLSEDLVKGKKKLLSQCTFCKKYFLYLNRKKYCSAACRQKAYYRRTPSLKIKSKERMKELRALYKEHGIK